MDVAVQQGGASYTRASGGGWEGVRLRSGEVLEAAGDECFGGLMEGEALIEGAEHGGRMRAVEV